MNALEHQQGVTAALLSRPPGGEGYRGLVARLAGIDGGSIVSTSEHLAPFNVLDALSFVVPQQLLGLDRAAPAKPRIVLLACGLVPLDNRHYARGFLEATEQGGLVRYNLFSQKSRKTSALLQPPVDPDTPALRRLLDAHPALAPCFAGNPASYAEQLGCAMSAMAGAWLGRRAEAPEVRAMPLEAVAAAVLAELIEQGDPAVSTLLFDAAARGAVRRALHGVFCAWGADHGTFLFWGAADRRIVRLEERQGALVDGADVVSRLQPEEIVAALKAGRLWPGVYLSLLAVSYLPAIPVSGGPKQQYYYSRMIETSNQVLGISRPSSLSVLGYMTFDPRTLKMQSIGRILSLGCGLDLLRSGLDAAGSINALAASPIMSGHSIPKYD
jgi:hypothetical protein